MIKGCVVFARVLLLVVVLAICFPAGRGSASLQRRRDATERPLAVSSSDQQDKIKLETKLVSLTVTVADPYGRFVTGLKKDNFEVYDDGVKQQISHFTDEDAPITMGFVYDVSGSMASLTGAAFQSLKKFFEMSHEDDEYFIIAFNTRPQLVQDFTTSPTEITDKVVFVKAKGLTALYDAVYIGIEKANQGRHKKKALLIISDGEENNSRYSEKEVRNRLIESDVPVYSVGLGSSYGTAVLNSLSAWSGGSVVFAGIGDLYTKIALMLRHQYVIGFYPTDTAAKVNWHKVRVAVNGPKGLGRLSLSYRNGYRSFNAPGRE